MRTSDFKALAAHGQPRRVHLRAGPVEYYDLGQGRPVLFLHGLMVNAAHWRHVAAELNDEYRLLLPTLPLGAHSAPMEADADLTPAGLADLLADFCHALDLDEVVVVANDTGGVIAQVLAARRPDILSGLVLVACDNLVTLEPWHPEHLIRSGFPRRPLVGAAEMLAMKAPDDVLTATYLGPITRDPAVVRDLHKVLKDLAAKQVEAHVSALRRFEGETLIVWAREDAFLDEAEGRRLQSLFPSARFEMVPDSRTFVPEDQPERLADLIRECIHSTSNAQNPSPAPALADRGSSSARTPDREWPGVLGLLCRGAG